MSPSLRALLTGIIDYAGLFPPAKLPLDQAIRNYARYLQEPESWMLGRFICPIARLPELAPHLDELFRSGLPVRISALGRGGASASAFRDGLRADLQALASFRNRQGDRVTVEALETCVPRDLIGDVEESDRGKELFEQSGLVGEAGLVPDQYYEILCGPDWRMELRALFGRLKDVGYYRQKEIGKRGLKLRCGGLGAGAFPSVEQVALAIFGACRAGVPLKFTAGLHHPIRRFDQGLGVTMHGFLNLFGAGVLALVIPRLNEEQVQQIVADADPESFHFDDQGFRWKDLRATTANINSARCFALTSFGSCSFDEPRDDLRALGLLD
jgi:hypothetical protein